MVDQITQWHIEHVQFSRLLDVLEAQVAAFHGGGRPNFGLMYDIVVYLRDYGDRVHHRREDAAFACLVERDPALRLPINRLLQEHCVIAAAGEDLVAQLEIVRLDAVVLRPAIEAAAAQYLAPYRHHLATEEREILPRAQRLLSAQDWSLVAASVPTPADPLFGDPPSAACSELRDALAKRARGADGGK